VLPHINFAIIRTSGNPGRWPSGYPDYEFWGEENYLKGTKDRHNAGYFTLFVIFGGLFFILANRLPYPNYAQKGVIGNE